MSTSTILDRPTATSDSAPAQPIRAFRWPAWLKEPLLHFTVVGVLMFAVSYAVNGGDRDPRTIAVSPEVDRQATEMFKSARGRTPTAEELAALRQAWLDNEVLYREGLEMQLDKGDDAIRDRVIFKALSVVDAATKLKTPDDKTLQNYFDRHRDRYDEPARFDFQEATLPGAHDETTVRALVSTINSGGAGDGRASLQIFKGRPRSNLTLTYGPEFVKAIEEAPTGEWHAYPSTDGWRAMRLLAITPAKPVSFEAVKSAVRQDWNDDELAAQRTAAVRNMGRRYRVKLVAPAP